MAKAITQRVTLEGAEKVASGFKDMGTAGNDAFTALATKVEALNARLNRLTPTAQKANKSFEDFARAGGRTAAAFDRMLSRIDGFNTGMGGIVSSTARAGLGLARMVGPIGLAIAGLAAVGAAMVALGVEGVAGINKASESAKRLGTSVNDFRQVNALLERTGLTAEEASTANKKLGDALKEAFTKFGPEAQTGVTVIRTIGTAADELMRKLVGIASSARTADGQFRPTVNTWNHFREILAQITSPVNQTKAAVDLLGEAVGNRFLSAVREGGAAWTKFITDMEAKTPQITEAQAKAAKEISDRWAAVGSRISGMWDSVANASLPVIENLIKGIELFAADFAKIGNDISAGWGAIWAAMSAVVQGAVDLWNSILNSIISKINAVKSAIGFGGANTETSGGASGGFARGGLVRGPGSATSDSILARLSAGEFVLNAAAVSLFGRGLLEQMNALRMPRGAPEPLAFPRLPGFAMGGPVTASAAATRNLTLVIDRQTFSGLVAPEDVAERLERFAISRGVRSAGRAPGWIG